MARRRHPVTDSQGRSFESLGDDVRAALAGTPMVAWAFLCSIKADWAEVCYTFAFANWRTIASPCFMCLCTVLNMYDDSRLSALSSPWEDLTMAGYDAACSLREINVRCCAALHKTLLALLFYDFAKNGSHGRALAADVAGTPLEAGDRLEPSDELPYTADLDRVNKFPINLVFWRVSPIDKILHRNPLFSEALGVVPGNLLVDLLHALLLGVIAQVSADLFWILVLNDVWGSRQDVTQAEWVHSGLIQMRGDFETWFDKLERSKPDWKSIKIQAITPGMVGTPAKRKLALKAVETKCFFQFLVDKLEEVVGQVCQGSEWLGVGRSLVTLQTRMEAMPWKVTQAMSQDYHRVCR